MTFPRLGGGTWVLTQEQVEEWRKVYPGVHIVAECQIAREWLLNHPSRLKKDVKRFLSNWLKHEARKVTKALTQGAYREPGPRPKQKTNFEELEKAVYRRCILDGDSEEEARRIAKGVVEGMRKSP